MRLSSKISKSSLVGVMVIKRSNRLKEKCLENFTDNNGVALIGVELMVNLGNASKTNWNP